jgi:predicted nucleic acid-binding protein
MNLIDTNVLLRYLTGDEQHYAGVFRLFERLHNREETVECPVLVFFQVIFVLKSFYRVPVEKITSIMQALLKIPGLYVPEKRVLNLTLDLWREHGGDIVDAYLAARSLTGRDRKIYSLDGGLDRLVDTRIAP